MRWFTALLRATHCRRTVLAMGLLLAGTSAARAAVTDIATGLPVRYASYIAEYDGWLYFSATDGVHGRELWQYDSTTNVASLAADINPGQYGSEVGELTVYNGQLYFAADNGYVPGLTSLQPQMMSLSEVPEPGSLALLACGAAALLWRWRRPRGER